MCGHYEAFPAVGCAAGLSLLSTMLTQQTEGNNSGITAWKKGHADDAQQ